MISINNINIDIDTIGIHIIMDTIIISVGIIPPHLQKPDCLNRKKNYSEILINAGSEVIIDSLNDLLDGINKFIGNSFVPK